MIHSCHTVGKFPAMHQLYRHDQKTLTLSNWIYFLIRMYVHVYVPVLKMSLTFEQVNLINLLPPYVHRGGGGVSGQEEGDPPAGGGSDMPPLMQ